MVCLQPYESANSECMFSNSCNRKWTVLNDKCMFTNRMHLTKHRCSMAGCALNCIQTVYLTSSTLSPPAETVVTVMMLGQGTWPHRQLGWWAALNKYTIRVVKAGREKKNWYMYKWINKQITHMGSKILPLCLLVWDSLPVELSKWL